MSFWAQGGGSVRISGSWLESRYWDWFQLLAAGMLCRKVAGVYSVYSVPASDIQSKYPSMARKKFSFIRNFLKFSLRSTLVRSLLNSLKIGRVSDSAFKV